MSLAAPAMETLPLSQVQSTPTRLVSLDAYRGLVMLLMASEGLGITHMASHFKESQVWQLLAYHTDHVEWIGCALWDLIQPSFSFIVGVALPYSLAKRQADGQSFGRMLFHAVFRAMLLIYLGIFLRSVGHERANFTFEDTLTQIGLGYTFLFLLAWTKPRVQIIAVSGILLLYWAAFALYPVPAQGFDYAKVGVSANWPHLQGFAAHWDKNTNLAAAFDQWFMNLFPRKAPFVYNGGGYQTLSFIPTLATMIFGLLAGELLRSSKSNLVKFGVMIGAGLGGLGIGWGLGHLGICPVVKRIWTPSWAIFSAGWAFLLLAFFFATTDWPGLRRWTFPLLVVGANSIAMYCMAHLLDSFIRDSFKIHLGQGIFGVFGDVYQPLVERATVLLVLWLILLWMYRRRVFVRI